MSIEVRRDDAVMALSYALSLEELAALAETREPVSERGGVVGVRRASCRMRTTASI